MQELMVVEPEKPVVQLADIVMRPYPQMEAALMNEMDRVSRLADQDPMGGLDQILRLMQGIDMEILKCMAPVMIESAQKDAITFTSRKENDSKRHNGRDLAQMLKLQEGIGKLGVARVKVRDEMDRRARQRSVCVTAFDSDRALGCHVDSKEAAGLV